VLRLLLLNRVGGATGSHPLLSSTRGCHLTAHPLSRAVVGDSRLSKERTVLRAEVSAPTLSSVSARRMV
jgi:hypothetical protein